MGVLLAAENQRLRNEAQLGHYNSDNNIFELLATAFGREYASRHKAIASYLFSKVRRVKEEWHTQIGELRQVISNVYRRVENEKQEKRTLMEFIRLYMELEERDDREEE
jgi:hypothetical protein